jgi:hypothetical protein
MRLENWLAGFNVITEEECLRQPGTLANLRLLSNRLSGIPKKCGSVRIGDNPTGTLSGSRTDRQGEVSFRQCHARCRRT